MGALKHIALAGTLGALFMGGAASAGDKEPGKAVARTTLAVASVYRGLEEPGRYNVANLFDGDGETTYCSVGRGVVRVDLSDADSAMMSKVTGVRVVPSHSHPAQRLGVWFHHRDPAVGQAARKVQAALGMEPETLAFVGARGPSPDGRVITIELDREKRNADRRPSCLADLEFVGPAGTLALPGLSSAIKAATARDAQLARLTNERSVFARAYLTSFDWVFFNPHKETTSWESAWYLFRADGTYESTTAHFVGRVERIVGRWSMNEGRTVMIDGRHHRLAPCTHRPGYLCFADHFRPAPAW
jgi:hypothetical protein